ncbi:MAG: hypothetical protein IJG37_09730 [Synergistaceae bacterium]|nr:hypothetical protein [Synergistaceae bacterium]MBQ3447907.1 hypothetical protein [Synergistaceae bacterium]MBQ3653472.1 hypothetical protein [Synergistaceae bacterium]
MEQLIYIGPNIFRLGMIRNQVYLEGLPGSVKWAVETFPELGELIVPASEFDTAQRQVRTKGTHLHHMYEEVTRKAGIK